MRPVRVTRPMKEINYVPFDEIGCGDQIQSGQGTQVLKQCIIGVKVANQ